MAVVIEAFSVILLLDAAEARTPGGAQALSAWAPHGTHCCDDDLFAISFMRSTDRAALVAELEKHGLELHRDFECAEEGAPLISNIIESGRYGGVLAAWRTGADREPLVVPLNYHANRVFFRSKDSANANLEFLERENDVEVYRDRQTGQRLYVGRATSPLEPKELETLDRQFEDGVSLVEPFLPLNGSRIHPGFWQRRKINRGIRLLKKVPPAHEKHGASLWLIGMSYRALEQHDDARAYLGRAHSLYPTQKEFSREYAAQLLILGDSKSAVDVSRSSCQRFPKDAGLRANLGLALLIAGLYEEAEREVLNAQARAPDDPITENLLRYIRGVRAGHTEAPTRLPGWD